MANRWRPVEEIGRVARATTRDVAFSMIATSVVVIVTTIGLSGRLLAVEPAVIPVPTPLAISSVPSSLVEDLRFLTSEELRGRSAIEPTIDVAGRYVADRFEEAGLQTRLFGDLPFQTFDVSVGAQPTTPEANFLTVKLGGAAAMRLTFGPGYSPLAIGIKAGVVTGGLVWVGYGINAPELKYNDYAGVDVQGKIVVMLRKEPGVNDSASPFGGRDNTRHAFFETKISTAIDAGAIGVLIVNDPASVQADLDQIVEQQQIERARGERFDQSLKDLPAEATNLRASLVEKRRRVDDALRGLEDDWQQASAGVLASDIAGTGPRRGAKEWIDAATGETFRRDPIPVASISRPLADRWLRHVNAAIGLAEIEAAIDGDWQPRSLAIPDSLATLAVEMTASTKSTSNVIGILPGRGGLAEQSVVIGAHYDHVGMGGAGSLAPGTIAVHNGADDNASGTATLMQVADRITEMMANHSSHRRLVFIAFSAEERGLLGSKYYVDHPRFPLANTVAMINMDMVGRLRDNELTVYGTGTAVGFPELLDQANASTEFRLFRVASGYGPSDHASFFEKGVPVLFFFTGLHQDYHRPSDDFEKLNLAGMTRITDIVSQVTERLAILPERPAYTSTSNNVAIRRQMTVFLGVSLSQQSWGVVLSSVSPDGPAGEAGLQTGDHVLRLGKQSIQTTEQLMDALRQRSPGDELSVVIDRDGQSITKTIKLRERS